jgi:hypothetical protein
MVHALALLAFLPPPIRMAVTGEDFAKFNDYSLEIVSEILDDGAGVTPFTLGIFSRLATLF